MTYKLRMKPLQLTLALLKPDIFAHPHRVKKIHELIIKNNFLIIRSTTLKLTREKAAEFYKEHTGKFFLERLLLYMTSGHMHAHILAKTNAIKDWRNLMGPTKVFRAQFENPDKIRGMYGLTDTRNATHGSDSPDSAKREMLFFFPDFKYDTWCVEEEPFFRSRQVYYDEKQTVHLPIKDFNLSK